MDNKAGMKTLLQAKELGDNRKRLKSRLQSAIGSLHRDVAKLFKNATFDFDSKRLVSKCGCYSLQWSAKETSVGVVVFVDHSV